MSDQPNETKQEKKIIKTEDAVPGVTKVRLKNKKGDGAGPVMTMLQPELVDKDGKKVRGDNWLCEWQYQGQRFQRGFNIKDLAAA